MVIFWWLCIGMCWDSMKVFIICLCSIWGRCLMGLVSCIVVVGELLVYWIVMVWVVGF